MNLYTAFTPPVLFVAKNYPAAKFYLSQRFPTQEPDSLRMVHLEHYPEVLSNFTDYRILSTKVLDLLHPKLF